MEVIEVGFNFGSGELGHWRAVVGIRYLFLSDNLSWFKLFCIGVSDIIIILDCGWP